MIGQITPVITSDTDVTYWLLGTFLNQWFLKIKKQNGVNAYRQATGGISRGPVKPESKKKKTPYSCLKVSVEKKAEVPPSATRGQSRFAAQLLQQRIRMTRSVRGVCLWDEGRHAPGMHRACTGVCCLNKARKQNHSFSSSKEHIPFFSPWKLISHPDVQTWPFHPLCDIFSPPSCFKQETNRRGLCEA